MTIDTTNFDSMHAIDKMQAVGALERENEEYKRTKEIREDAGKSCSVLEVIELGEFVFVKVRSRLGEREEHYKIYINGKRSNRICYNLEAAVITASIEKYDGINTQARRLICQMLGIKDGPAET